MSTQQAAVGFRGSNVRRRRSRIDATAVSTKQNRDLPECRIRAAPRSNCVASTGPRIMVVKQHQVTSVGFKLEPRHRSMAVRECPTYYRARRYTWASSLVRFTTKSTLKLTLLYKINLRWSDWSRKLSGFACHLFAGRHLDSDNLMTTWSPATFDRE